MLQSMKIYMAKSHLPSHKNKIIRIDDFEHWPASIKSTIQWFPLHTIMEYTGNIMQDYTHLTSSLLKMFSMIGILLSCGDNGLDIVSLKCVNCKKETGLNAENGFNGFYDEVITQFVLNEMLHHVDMSWIISSKKEMDYDNFTNIKKLEWFDTGPWYNKNICSKLHGITFEDFSISDTAFIICFIFLQPIMSN